MHTLRRPAVQDAAIGVALAGLGVAELASMRPDGWGWGVLIELVACALLTQRRRNPLVFATLAPVVVLALPWVGPQLDEPAMPLLLSTVAIYTLARWVPDLRGLVGVGVIAVVILADYLGADQRDHGIDDAVFVSAFMVPPYAFGRITRRLSEQKALLETQQALVRAAAVRDERDRIAREMHDVIAHSISAMTVQTAAAQDLVRLDPDAAEQLLAEAADTGRRALDETGRLLHVLRDEHDELGLAPAPGLADLADLVERFREQGLAVDADLPEPVPPVPAGVDVSAYRIAQEVLTNALRYAADRTVALRVALAGPTLAIAASNAVDGRSGVGSGLGLLGVAERVEMLGGTLRHGTRDGRFELEALVPVEGAAS